MPRPSCSPVHPVTPANVAVAGIGTRLQRDPGRRGVRTGRGDGAREIAAAVTASVAPAERTNRVWSLNVLRPARFSVPACAAIVPPLLFTKFRPSPPIVAVPAPAFAIIPAFWSVPAPSIAVPSFRVVVPAFVSVAPTAIVLTPDPLAASVEPAGTVMRRPSCRRPSGHAGERRGAGIGTRLQRDPGRRGVRTGRGDRAREIAAARHLRASRRRSARTVSGR